jgi:hypothetical protein
LTSSFTLLGLTCGPPLCDDYCDILLVLVVTMPLVDLFSYFPIDFVDYRKFCYFFVGDFDWFIFDEVDILFASGVFLFIEVLGCTLLIGFV